MMADPISPRLGNEALIEQMSLNHPNMTREEIIEIAAAFGFDLDVDTEKRGNNDPG